MPTQAIIDDGHLALDLTAFDVAGGGSTFEKKIDKSEQFLFNIIKTLIRRIDQGVIKIEGTRDE